MSLDAIKQKMSSLRVQQEETQAKYEELQDTVKRLEQEKLQYEHTITSLSHNVQRLETENEKLFDQVKEAKAEGAHSKEYSEEIENLQRRVQTLDGEVEQGGKDRMDINAKYLNEAVKSEKLEHKVKALESSGEAQEVKYEKLQQELHDVKKSLQDFQEEIGNI